MHFYLFVMLFVGKTVCGASVTVDNTGQNRVFCGEYDCPLFQTLKVEQDYEVRQYEMTTWLTTEFSANSTGYKKQKKKAFWSLYSYIKGKNDQGVAIPMTIPVTTKVYPCYTEGCNANYAMSFFIAPAFLEDTPMPTEPGLFIEERPPTTFFVRSFKGWTCKIEDHEANIEALKEAVGDGANTSFYYMASYGPYRSEDAHNEGWLEAL